ncbi:unnamed protein product [Polarella glacialis]|uniref:Uncharacterized protein n=1 Tax=Polarella glacialis TaxID=89957 RepID=A0A813DXT3_POLGL|nr:unnamed protein product [Polarella glacialis]
MTTRAHWDIPVPSYACFESRGGISSSGVAQDMRKWVSLEFQRQLAAAHPWGDRLERAFFRGHDWDSSNTFSELLPELGPNSCVDPMDLSTAFGYRRWYAQLSQPGAALHELLDVGLTGAPDFVKQQYPN